MRRHEATSTLCFSFSSFPSSSSSSSLPRDEACVRRGHALREAVREARASNRQPITIEEGDLLRRWVRRWVKDSTQVGRRVGRWTGFGLSLT